MLRVLRDWHNHWLVVGSFQRLSEHWNSRKPNLLHHCSAQWGLTMLPMIYRYPDGRLAFKWSGVGEMPPIAHAMIAAGAKPESEAVSFAVTSTAVDELVREQACKQLGLDLKVVQKNARACESCEHRKGKVLVLSVSCSLCNCSGVLLNGLNCKAGKHKNARIGD
jgi:hypothetical protein